MGQQKQASERNGSVLREGSLEIMDEYVEHKCGKKCDAGIQVVPQRGREYVSLRALAALPLPETEFPNYMRSTPHTITWLGILMVLIFCVSMFACPVDPWWRVRIFCKTTSKHINNYITSKTKTNFYNLRFFRI